MIKRVTLNPHMEKYLHADTWRRSSSKPCRGSDFIAWGLEPKKLGSSSSFAPQDSSQPFALEYEGRAFHIYQPHEPPLLLTVAYNPTH